MWEAITEVFTSGDIWSIIIKVLLTALVSGLVGLVGTLIGKIIAKNKDSKIYKYASVLVEAAEQKFPNEGTKMGPQKMEYVMSQLIIKFPKIADNQYLYNIVESAVYKLNEERRKEKLQEEFEEKYGESPIDIEDTTSTEEIEVEEKVVEETTTTTTQEKSVVEEKAKSETKKVEAVAIAKPVTTTKAKQTTKLTSF